MIHEVNERYINNVQIQAEKRGVPISHEDLEELRSHILCFGQEHESSSLTNDSLEKLIYQEFGSPSTLVKEISTEKNDTNYSGKSKVQPFFLIITVAIILMASFSPFKYAPIGILFVAIALKAIITKDPFSFAYYKKNPDKVNHRGPFWFYNTVLIGLGIVFLVLEWMY
ncbi:hypothetical protein [Radiobacillus deserti]|uniref:Uncharacterized protein n=1 Tax=Radiobacillus deserti TaxID=2594883 RepID=A0A516KKC6_9BACI|nr:hypothetical protein [Radiobacillus deserti]QDP41849.1 hypothetical protein FN924_17730 [Radiobacillus deserti]